jgi:hypothetical protein
VTSLITFIVRVRFRANFKIVSLKCYRRSDSSTIPDILLKEIKCSGNETKIITFDYKTTNDEAFNFYLILENNRKAIAVATLTQYFQKEKN